MTYAERYADFIKVWRESNNATEVAERLDMLAPGARRLACQLRQAGIDLPRFKRGPIGIERRAPNHGNTRFIAAWQASSDWREVVRNTGLSWDYARFLALRIRKTGVKLRHITQPKRNKDG